MDAIIERCCGLDVHQATVVACLLSGGPHEKPRKLKKTFSTMTRDLLALREWLVSMGCTHVAMESTGVYWKPVYAVLEGAFDIVVGNAHHIKNVPGRKTDMNDAEWIAMLLRHGLIRKSFVPPKPIRDLRDLTRYRRSLVNGRAAERNRLLKLLEGANIKLSSVVSDVFGVSGMSMLKALLDGNMTQQEMAELARGRLRKKIAPLVLALDGRLDEHHRFLLRTQLGRLEAIDKDIAAIERQIDSHIEPYRAALDQLVTIPGIDVVTATEIIAEIGTDISAFKSANHLAAWAGVCPGNRESAGKQQRSAARDGNVYLKSALIRAAITAVKKKGTYLKSKYWKLKARRGAMRAIVAIAHKILIAIYHMLSNGTSYEDLGETYLDRLHQEHLTKELIKRLDQLGFDVALTPKAA